MSLVHLAAVVVATPTPSPTVIKETLQTVVQPVAQTPDVVVQLAAVLGTAVAALVISLFHQIASSKVAWLRDNVNRLVVALYTVGVGLVSAFSQGQLHWDATGVVTSLLMVSVAVATALGRYQLFQFVATLVKRGSKVSSDVEAALATDVPDETPAPV